MNRTAIYFDKIHPSHPVLHRYRYYASMSLSPQARPPVCLRYAMWASAAAITDRYKQYQDIFYRRARKYLENDEMRSAGQGIATIAHAQTWTLVGMYEFKMMFFPRAWMSVGRAARMVLMAGLNRLDGEVVEAKKCLPPPRDWVELEERRRTFWMVYCMDRYASLGTGWPMALDERDVSNLLSLAALVSLLFAPWKVNKSRDYCLDDQMDVLMQTDYDTPTVCRRII